MKIVKALGLLALSIFLVGCNVSNTPIKEDYTIVDNIVDIEEKDKEDSKVIEKSETTLNNVEIHFINTGNSDAILIKEGNNSMLIDGGDTDDGGKVIDYLKKYDVSKLDYIIATHPHADHIGGLADIIESIPVDLVYVANGDAETKTYREFINSAMAKGIQPSVPLENKKFTLGKSYFEVYNTNGGNSTNNMSLVVKYTNGNDTMLFMGDAEVETEEELRGKIGKVDLLKVGHHGSSSSSSLAFLEEVNPEYAIITCSTGNKYGHPHKEVVDRLQSMGIEVHRNDECGDVVFTSTGNSIKTSCSVGSYTAGDTTKSTGSKENKVESTNKPADSTNKPISNTGKVYWTPNGKSYHSTDACSTLSRSKTILSGTIAESGRNDACDKCN